MPFTGITFLSENQFITSKFIVQLTEVKEKKKEYQVVQLK